MPKGGNGGGGGKPGGDNGGGDSGSSWKGSRRSDTLKIVDDGAASGTDDVEVTDFLAGTFDAGRGIDTLDFSDLTSDGISVRIYGNKFQESEISLEQGNLGLIDDYGRGSEPGLVFGTVLNFDNLIGTGGDDDLRVNSGEVVTVQGGAGDDRIVVLASAGSVAVGGAGSDHFHGYNEFIYVGGNWDGTYGPQAGDGETDIFESQGVILDFELASGSFAGDQLLISGGIGADNPDAVDQVLALQFVAGTWTDPDGVEHDAAILPTISGDGALFTLVGIDPADANALILPELRFKISTFEDFLLSGGPGDDAFLLYGEGNEVLFELDGGSDTLLYHDSMDPTDDTLYFEDDVPTDWTYDNDTGVDRWTTQYNGQTVTILGLDQAGFDSLSMVAVPPDTFG